MPKRIFAILLQATLGLALFALPFANLIGTNPNDVWVWIGIVVGMIILAPFAVAFLTGCAHSLILAGRPGHRRGMALGYLLGIAGGAAVHAGLVALYLSAGFKLDAVILLFGGAVIADVLLFVAGYRMRTPRIEPLRLRPRATPDRRTGRRPAA
jgi:hypothetical protein